MLLLKIRISPKQKITSLLIYSLHTWFIILLKVPRAFESPALTVEVMLIVVFLPWKATLYYIWGNCITVVYYSERRDCERAKRKLQHICCRLYPFGLLDEIERIGNCFVDVAQIGWTTYICVSVLFALFCILFPHLFYCFAILFFNTISIFFHNIFPLWGQTWCFLTEEYPIECGK